MLRKSYTSTLGMPETRINAGFFGYVIIEWE